MSHGIRRAALLVGLLVLVGCGKPDETVAVGGGNPYADPACQSAEKSALNQLMTQVSQAAKRYPDRALPLVAQWVAKDPNNANAYYLRAAAYCVKGLWTPMTEALETGNAQASAYLYLTSTDPAARLLPHFVLARDIARCAPLAGEECLAASRRMGLKLCGQEPRTVLGFLGGAAVVNIANSRLVQYHRDRHQEAQAARAEQLAATDRAWIEQGRAKVTVYLEESADEYQKVGAAENTQSVSVARQEKLAKLSRKLLAQEAGLVGEILATQPR